MLNIALNLPPQGHVYSLDLPENHHISVADELFLAEQSLEVFELAKGSLLTPYLDQLPITVLRGESTSFDFSPWYGQMDLVFIDGGHTTKVIASDTLNAFKLLKSSGGIILWHDYLLSSCPDVYYFLNTLGKEHRLYVIEGTKTVIFCSEEEIDLSKGMLSD
jgi:predicted O-methyltransferase YrrM